MPYWVALNAEFERRGAEYSPMVAPYRAAAGRGEGPCLSRPDLVADADWYGTEYYQQYHGPSRADVMMYCLLPQRNGRVSGVVLVRPTGEPDFPRRAKAVIAAAHVAVAPLIGGPLAGYADPPPGALPPRVRQVLRCLLEGDSDKQVATRLGIGAHTVNQYVKRVYHYFGVRSRPELLARWVRRGWGGRFAWADPDTD
jgi:DNA-binding CsgD family transcriptional regulator